MRAEGVMFEGLFLPAVRGRFPQRRVDGRHIEADRSWSVNKSCIGTIVTLTCH
jgi:hypothetical protein